MPLDNLDVETACRPFDVAALRVDRPASLDQYSDDLRQLLFRKLVVTPSLRQPICCVRDNGRLTSDSSRLRFPSLSRQRHSPLSSSRPRETESGDQHLAVLELNCGKQLARIAARPVLAVFLQDDEHADRFIRCRCWPQRIRQTRSQLHRHSRCKTESRL